MKKDGIHSMVGSVLRGLLDRHPAFAANPFGDWNELVGEQLARHTRQFPSKGKPSSSRPTIPSGSTTSNSTQTP